MSSLLPAGTTIFISKRSNTRNNNISVCVGTNQVLEDDTVFVLYDVRNARGMTIIPKGSRIIGDWVSENYEVQFQAREIYLGGVPQEFLADSEVITPSYNSLNGRNKCVGLGTTFGPQSIQNLERKMYGTICKESLGCLRINVTEIKIKLIQDTPLLV